MTTFIMSGKYSAEGLKGISAERTNKASDLVKSFGGEIVSIYAVLGSTDLVLIVNLPGIEEAMKFAVSLSKSTGIAFNTSPAVKVEEFDKLMAGI